MKILIAPNAFKGTMTAEEASAIIREVIYDQFPDTEFILCPIADGGDGTSYLLAKALALPLSQMVALDALGRPVPGYYAMDIESSSALLDVSTVSGIHLLQKEERDPFCTCTYGTGELIRAALAEGAKHIELGLGGTASIDMGIGVLRGLGFLFLDQNGREVPMFSPGYLDKIKHIQRPLSKLDLEFTLLCDVENTFFGPQGAIPVFGAQKGLPQEREGDLIRSAEYFFGLLKSKTKKHLQDQPGFGAAGGIAMGLSAFFPVEIVNGSDYFFQKVNMEEHIKWADLIITGEGKYDEQSAQGKGSYKLMKLAKKSNKKIVLITSGNDYGEGFDDVIYLPPLGPKKESEEAMASLHTSVKAFFKEIRI